MTIFLGADHGGFELKNQLKIWLSDQGHQVEDCGAFAMDAQDDYPDFAFAVADKVANQPESRGILLCRSGGGMTIAANKVRGIRAVTVDSVKAAAHAREHHDANIISLGADWLNPDDIQSIITTFLNTPASPDVRHVRRRQKIATRE